MWWWLAACAPQVPDASPAPVSPADVSPEPAPEDPWCRAAPAEDGDLAVHVCARVSPEPGEEWPWDDDHVHEGEGGDPAPPASDQPRCGTFNVLSVFGTAGVGAPRTVYCDAADGLRLAEIDGATGGARYHPLAASCLAAPDAGFVSEGPDGLRALWLAVRTDGSTVVNATTVDASFATSTASVDAWGVARLAPIAGDDGAVAVDADGTAALLAANGGLGDPLPARGAVAAGRAGNALVLAGCDDAGDAGVWVDGAVIVQEKGCWSWSTPVVAVGGGGWAAGWRGDAGSVLVVNGEVVAFPDGGAIGLVADDETFLATVGGRVLRLAPDGSVLAARRHPILAGAGDDLETVRLARDGDSVRFEATHRAAVSAGDHVFVYNRLEVTLTDAW